MASNDIVFSFGGIGATPDDHTRRIAAGGRAGYERHPQALALIEAQFGDEGVSKPGAHGRSASGLQADSQSGQSHSRLHGQTASLCARFSQHGLADDRLGAGYALPATAFAQPKSNVGCWCRTHAKAI